MVIIPTLFPTLFEPFGAFRPPLGASTWRVVAFASTWRVVAFRDAPNATQHTATSPQRMRFSLDFWLITLIFLKVLLKLPRGTNVILFIVIVYFYFSTLRVAPGSHTNRMVTFASQSLEIAWVRLTRLTRGSTLLSTLYSIRSMYN